MISAKTALTRYNVSTTSVMAAVQEVGILVREDANPLKMAHTMIEAITGVTRVYDDLERAIHVAQHCAEIAVKRDSFDPEEEISNGERRDEELRRRQPWLYAKAEPTASSTENIAVIANSDVKVAVKADGKIKKGGKEVLAAELYRIHITEAETPVDNQGFIAILVKELGMTKAGATTYNYNMKKKFGGKIDPKKK